MPLEQLCLNIFRVKETAFISFTRMLLDGRSVSHIGLVRKNCDGNKILTIKGNMSKILNQKNIQEVHELTRDYTYIKGHA